MVVPGQEYTTRFFFFFGGANRGAERGRSAGGECMTGIVLQGSVSGAYSTEYNVQ